MMSPEVYRIVMRRVAGKYRNFGVITDCRESLQGWVNFEKVYEQNLKPILSSSEGVVFPGCHRGWLADVQKKFVGEIPEWALFLNAALRECEDGAVLQVNDALAPEMLPFWKRPFFYLAMKGGKRKEMLLPAFALIMCRRERFPVGAFVANAVMFISKDNLWAGGREQRTAKQWLEGAANDELLFIPFRSLSSLYVSGTSAAVEDFVDKVMIEGAVAARVDEFAPKSWSIECDVRESAELCAERILEKVMGPKK